MHTQRRIAVLRAKDQPIEHARPALAVAIGRRSTGVLSQLPQPLLCREPRRIVNDSQRFDLNTGQRFVPLHLTRIARLIDPDRLGPTVLPPPAIARVGQKPAYGQMSPSPEGSPWRQGRRGGVQPPDDFADRAVFHDEPLVHPLDPFGCLQVDDQPFGRSAQPSHLAGDDFTGEAEGHRPEHPALQ